MNEQRLEEQIRRYTEAMDALASPLEELVPEELREELGTRGERVEVTIPLSPHQRAARPAWIYGLAAALAVMILAVPIWLWVSDDEPDVADTTPTTPTTVTSPTLPGSFDLGDYPLVFDGPTHVLSGSGWDPGVEVVATMDVLGVVETRSAIPDDRGRFVTAPFSQCCADFTPITVTQGDRTMNVRIDRGISVERVDAERDIVTLAYGGGFEVVLVVEGGDVPFTNTVSPDSDWWSIDLTGEVDIVQGTAVTAVLLRDDVAFTDTTTAEQGQSEAIFYLDSQVFEGRGFLPDTPVELSVNGEAVGGSLTTDDGGHFVYELQPLGMEVFPNDVLTFRHAGDTYETNVPVLTFDALDGNGRATGTAIGVDEVSDVVVQIREADGSRREAVANGIPVRAGAWTVSFPPLADGDTVEDASVMGRVSIFGFVVDHKPLTGPIQNPENGHFYEAVTVLDGLTWEDAEALSRGWSFNGVAGHLLTITSENESDFVVTYFPQAVVSGPGRSTFWLGGSQPLGSDEPSGGWEWVTGEPFTYQNWDPGEPNDNESPEQCLNFAAGGLGVGSWNDQPCGLLGSGYIVEYDTAG
jgi:hypothetical protein